jgi:hypothetical protein
MLLQPRPHLVTGMTGEIISNQIEPSCRMCLFKGFKKADVLDRVARKPSVLVWVRQIESVVLKSRVARRFHGIDPKNEHAAGQP